MKRLTILMCLFISIATNAQDVKDKIEVLKSTRVSNYPVEKIAKVADQKIINFNEMIMKINNNQYRCWGAGGNIRCLLTPG